MPRKKRSLSPIQQHFEEYIDEDFDDEISSNGSRNHLHPPIQRNAANARERARMRVLSSAFCRLKTKLPWVPADTKLSKLDTLRLAKIYIEQLRARLAGEEEGETLHPQNLIWLGFQQHLDIGQSASITNQHQWFDRLTTSSTTSAISSSASSSSSSSSSAASTQLSDLYNKQLTFEPNRTNNFISNSHNN